MKEDCQMGCSKTLVQRKDASGEEAFGLVQLILSEKDGSSTERKLFLFSEGLGKAGL